MDINYQWLNEVHQRIQAASPGPWRVGGGKFGEHMIQHAALLEPITDEVHFEADAQLMAHARNDLPKMIDLIQILIAENSILREQIHDAEDSRDQVYLMLRKMNAELNQVRREVAEVALQDQEYPCNGGCGRTVTDEHSYPGGYCWECHGRIVRSRPGFINLADVTGDDPDDYPSLDVGW